MQADGGEGLAEAHGADGLEELCAVAEEERRSGDGVPEDVAEAAQGGVEGDGGLVGVGAAGERGIADLVPVGVDGLGGGCANALEARGASGCGRVRTASETLPVWSASVSSRCWVRARGAPARRMLSHLSEEEICSAMRGSGSLEVLRTVMCACIVSAEAAGLRCASRS
jgi:hypothetical protein